jgi:DNA-binding winged helix-turn-helix (wHTH) protein
LAGRINAARAAIGDNGQQQRLIRTVERKGIRFVGAACEEQRATSNAPEASMPRPALSMPASALPDESWKRVT